MIYKIKSNIIRRAVLLVAAPVIVTALLLITPILILFDGLYEGARRAVKIIKREARWVVRDFSNTMLCIKKCWRGESV